MLVHAGHVGRSGLRFLDPKQESRRSQHRHHRVRQAGLEGFARLNINALRQVHQSIHRVGVDRPAKRLPRESRQHLMRVGSPFRRRFWIVAREKALVILRPRPILFLRRPANRDRYNAELQRVDLLARRCQRRDLEPKPVFAGGPFLVEFKSKCLPVVPAEFLFQRLTIVDLENQPALARIEIEIALHSDFKRHMIASRLFHLDAAFASRGFIIGNRQERISTGPATILPRHGRGSRRGRVRAMKLVSSHHLLRYHPRNRRDGFGDNRARRPEVFFQEHWRQREHVPNVIKAVPGVVGREFHLGMKINSHQIPDGVAVFDPVQPSNRDAAGIGIFWVNAKRVVFDPILQTLLLFRGRTGLFFWRHDACAGVLQDVPPELVVFEESALRLELVESHSSLARSIAMTIVAIVIEDRLDFPVKGIKDRTGRTRHHR